MNIFEDIIDSALINAADEIISTLNSFKPDGNTPYGRAIRALGVLMDMPDEDNVRTLLKKAMDVDDERAPAVHGLLSIIPVAETQTNLRFIVDLVNIINNTRTALGKLCASDTGVERIVFGKDDHDNWEYQFQKPEPEPAPEPALFNEEETEDIEEIEDVEELTDYEPAGDPPEEEVVVKEPEIPKFRAIDIPSPVEKREVDRIIAGITRQQEAEHQRRVRSVPTLEQAMTQTLLSNPGRARSGPEEYRSPDYPG